MSTRRIDDIEVLRGFAVSMVIVHHAFFNLFNWRSPDIATFKTYFNGGIGVDLFFAISGFVIAMTLLPRLDQTADRSEHWKLTLAFWVRRAWRLLPSAWLWLGVLLALTLFFNESGVFRSFRVNLEGTIAAVLNVANIRFAYTFFERPMMVNFVYWSLSLEEQFYLFLPLFALYFRRWMVPVFLLAIFVQVITTRDIWWSMFRTDAILLGVLLAIWSRQDSYGLFRPSFLEGRPIFASVGLLCVLLLLAAVGSDKLQIVPARMGLVAIISVTLVWLASYNANLFFPWKPVKGLLLWLGTRSYALYLIHIPVFLASRELWFRLTPPGTPIKQAYALELLLTASLLLVALAEINYRFLERPLRDRGKEIALGIERG